MMAVAGMQSPRLGDQHSEGCQDSVGSQLMPSDVAQMRESAVSNSPVTGDNGDWCTPGAATCDPRWPGIRRQQAVMAPHRAAGESLVVLRPWLSQLILCSRDGLQSFVFAYTFVLKGVLVTNMHIQHTTF